MKFSKLYHDNRTTVEHYLASMWCADTGSDSQAAYARQLRTTIRQLFAPDEAMPVVQCMNSYEAVRSVPADEAKALVGRLWRSTRFAPYEHQYQCWKALLEERTTDGLPMSVCVTTGTGSGKTECFMMPLVKDLIDSALPDRVQALFLYPLNALMEDQKERLEQLLDGTTLTYTVFNGDLPEREPAADDHSASAELVRKRISQIRGWDEASHTYRFKHLLYTRDQVRRTPPNILLTNPTMLEYILLREKDAVLTNPELRSLRWVAIDETHTYTGAGAAELAMLLRRVLLAFGVKPSEVRFATSSATFGNGADPDGERRELQQFISGITGVRTDQVKVVGGERVGVGAIPDDADGEVWRTLFRCEYVPLGELIADGTTIEEKLALLDALCERVPTADGVPALKAKVHFFYRVPNNGLYVRLTEHADGAFRIYTTNDAKADTADAPLLELSRCRHCGEYVALAWVDHTPGADYGKYHALEREDSDMFDLTADDEADGLHSLAVIALSDQANAEGDNNAAMDIVGGRLLSDPTGGTPGSWHIVANTKCRCPRCNGLLTRRRNSDEDEGRDLAEEADAACLVKFRTSPEFISRVMASSVLDNLDRTPDTATPDGRIILHGGQQYISFADSRQLAARATLKQNLEQERDWVYSRIFHELCRRRAAVATIDAEIAQLTGTITSIGTDVEKLTALLAQINALKQQKRTFLTWMEVAQLLKGDPLCRLFCAQFVKRSGDSEELEADGTIRGDVVDKYVQAIMVMHLSTRPVAAASPETLGLFCACYPQLERIGLPEAVERFNAVLANEANRISRDDWHHLLQIFMDYTVRSNQSLYLKIDDTNPIDIFACERFATEKPRRRPAKLPVLDEHRLSTARAVRYLVALLREERGGRAGDVYREHFPLIRDVMLALWADLTREGSELLQLSEAWDKDERRFKVDPTKDAPPYRLNLRNLCFKLYDDVYLCDTNTDASPHHTVRLRPIENHFKHFAPYLAGGRVARLQETLHEHWVPFPADRRMTPDEVEAWARLHRRLLCDNRLWADDGTYGRRLTNIYAGPDLFIQAEHTAQVDKDVSRTLQADFKRHAINVLACSTTMEMGVDLGNLEVVMLTSVPPMPANYKQRAGRSGRNNKVKSACITLCGSDAIGLRTLFAPIDNIISRPVSVPMVDLMSPQVVQRHVNSFLVRAFGVFRNGDCGGRLTQAVFNYYSPFVGRREGRFEVVVRPDDNAECSPNERLGDPVGTMYEAFNRKCMEPLPDNVRDGLEALLRDTVYDGQLTAVVDNALKDNKRCYKELSTQLDDLRLAFRDATNDRFRTRLMMQYCHVLTQRLLNFWATNRFTPNANMPVEVLSLDLSSLGTAEVMRTSVSSNPSYGLREAIAQYAPGNSIVVDGVAYVVRGVQFANMYEGARPFKKIYRNREKCVIDDATAIDRKLRWGVNGKEWLELVQPVGFVPDVNEDKNRVMDSNRYTHVSAQLIGTTDWADIVTEPHLFSVRSNREAGYAKILYYNEGIGFGYCLCAKCGRTVVETDVADDDNALADLPDDMNPCTPKRRNPDEPERPRFHYAVAGRHMRKYCPGSADATAIRRNVIVGGLIQTDFAEIRLRHKGEKRWMNSRTEDRLLFTLGIVLTQALLDTLGKERGAVDFTVMPNGHLCLFDTNPGGAGYANQLSNVTLMKEVVGAAKRMLEDAKRRHSKDFLLNKFTLRYIDLVDIDEALDWIVEEEEARGVLPDEVAAVSTEATETSSACMAEALAGSVQQPMLFVSDDFACWDYEGMHGWRTHFLGKLGIADGRASLCVVRRSDAPIPEPALSVLRSAKAGWAKEVVQMPQPEGMDVCPVAYVGGTLYFTNNAENATFNDAWAAQTLYGARVPDIATAASPVDCTFRPDTKIVMLDDERTAQLPTTDLFAVLNAASDGIVGKFVAHCKAHDERLTISYQDEHLKSIVGMVLTLQTIGAFVREVGRDFTLEFLMEVYEDANGRDTVTANLANNAVRDSVLTNLTTGWLNDLENGHGIDGRLIPVRSKPYRTLPHWRVLTIECAGKCLCIYPDGGFANGWKLLRDWTVNSKHFTPDNTDTRDRIVLKRCQDIKFDIVMQDC